MHSAALTEHQVRDSFDAWLAYSWMTFVFSLFLFGFVVL